MKILAGYCVFILILVFIYTVKDWINAETKERRRGAIAGTVILSPIILFFILLFCGVRI